MFTLLIFEEKSKEKTSISHQDTLNQGRLLSSHEVIASFKVGKKMDCVFKAGTFEFGCLEIGCNHDKSKIFKESGLKQPFILKDMMNFINKSIPVKEKVHIRGYSIYGTVHIQS